MGEMVGKVEGELELDICRGPAEFVVTPLVDREYMHAGTALCRATGRRENRLGLLVNKL